jgi:redox-regulated HSP33 family molecular chaperone
LIAGDAIKRVDESLHHAAAPQLASADVGRDLRQHVIATEQVPAIAEAAVEMLLGQMERADTITAQTLPARVLINTAMARLMQGK